jgi:putative transposase
MQSIEALALVGGHVNEELLARNDYLATENRILKGKFKLPIKFNDCERIQLATIGKRIGTKALKEIGCIVNPDTILKWFRQLVAKKFDGSKNRSYPGRPRTSKEIEKLVVSMAKDNIWGYLRIAGALENLGYEIDPNTVKNILKRNGLPSSPERSPNNDWASFIKSHEHVMAACDFFTQEVLTPVRLVTYYVLFFIHHSTRQVHIAGVTDSLCEDWMRQMARNITMEDWGFLNGIEYLIMDRDPLFCASFRQILKDKGVKPIRLPPKSPNLNAFAERWVRSVKDECLSRIVCFGEQSLRRVLCEYVKHYNEERNHQGKNNKLLFPTEEHNPGNKGEVKCRERLGGLLKFYYREPVFEGGWDFMDNSAIKPCSCGDPG